MTITIKCPKCSNVIEVDSEWLGQRAQCPYCQEKFIIEDTSRASVIRSCNSSVQRPKMLWVALIWLYVLFGISILGNLLESKVPMESIVMACFMLWGVYRIQQGSNKARLTITIILGVLTIFFSFNLRMMGFVSMLIFIIPVVFLWLPQCNVWFKEQQRIRDMDGIK